MTASDFTRYAKGSELLRLITAGSVDDGKSTLIGRMLYDAQLLFEDQLAAVCSPKDGVNLANLTDGLRAEREQGITIDVAYRYFATPRRRFILADTPGHLHFTRSMVSGASTAYLALILVDAQRGVTEQTMRHAYLATFLGIPQLVVCINKLDLVGFSAEVFLRIQADFADFASRFAQQPVSYFPISALRGDNVVNPSANTPWYQGPSLLDYLEQVPVSERLNFQISRLPVQFGFPPVWSASADDWGVAGQIATGVFRVGQRVRFLPSDCSTVISAIIGPRGHLAEAWAPMSVTIRFEDRVKIDRGEILVDLEHAPCQGTHLVAKVCWLSAQSLVVGKLYLIKHCTQLVPATVTKVLSRLDIKQFTDDPSAETLSRNELGQVEITSSAPLIYDWYEADRTLGSFIIIDVHTHETVGAGLLLEIPRC